MATIVVGTDFYGKIDKVYSSNGQLALYVTTKFLHFCYFPILPQSSHIVLAGTEQSSFGMEGSHYQFQGQEIPIDWKSASVGWLRAVAVLAFLVTMCMGFMIFLDPDRAGDRGWWCFKMLLIFATFGLTFALAKATPERAEQLKKMAGFAEPS